MRERGVIKALDAATAQKLIEGYTDVIAAEAKADAAFYRQFVCPTCHSDMIHEYLGGPRGVGTTWLPGCATPQAVLRCLYCRLLMNPRSGLILEQGIVPVVPVDDDLTGLRRRSS